MVEEGAAAEIEVALEVAANPTIKIIKIKVNKISPMPNHTNEVPSIRTYLPTLGGPALSIGRKAGELPTAPIPSSASGIKSLPLVLLPPEKSASLE